jgi:hypothetical protein
MNADEIISKIIEDISGRKGIGDEWEDIDEDIRKEIIDEWRSFFPPEVKESVPWSKYL